MSTGLPEPVIGDDEGLVFDYVPPLRDDPERVTRGLIAHPWPGIRYAMVCTKNMRREQRNGWRLIRGAAFFSIEGPRGTADVALMGDGSPIPGASPDSGSCEVVYDPDIVELTGHVPSNVSLEELGIEWKDEGAGDETTVAGDPAEPVTPPPRQRLYGPVAERGPGRPKGSKNKPKPGPKPRGPA